MFTDVCVAMTRWLDLRGVKTKDCRPALQENFHTDLVQTDLGPLKVNVIFFS